MFIPDLNSSLSISDPTPAAKSCILSKQTRLGCPVLLPVSSSLTRALFNDPILIKNHKTLQRDFVYVKGWPPSGLE